jgi:hypothetical protein
MTNPYYILSALIIGYWLGRYSSRNSSFRLRIPSFQNQGEALVARKIQANFKVPDFHLLNHITLKLDDGTTQIDHILVSCFGVFVIETKDYSGWIFADPKHATWTQVLYRLKFKFQNPIFQNFRHVKSVEALLDFLPATAIKSAVVFVGDAEFQTDIPSGVYTLSGFINYLQNCNEQVMSLNRVQFCVGRLETARLAITRKTDLEHVKDLDRRHGIKD